MRMDRVKGKITINDVAEAAGVSKGTVDRVLHNRGDVSEKSRQKVMKVVEELGFSPNLYASLLASKKNHRIICLIPEYRPGEFWELTERGISKGRDDVARFGVAVDIMKYDQYDIESFRKACAETIAARPSGVILAPMFRSDTLSFVNELSASGILYAYIDSKLEEDNYLAYFGMPMYQSGYLCADILTGGRNAEKIYIIRILRDKKGLSDPTASRRAGFIDYIGGHFPECVIENVYLDPKDRAGIAGTLDKLFSEDDAPEKKLVMFNSRVHLVAEYLKDRNIRGCRLVGFDVLEKNLAYLREGFIDVLIAQHSDQQAAAAINSIVETVIMQRPLPKRDYFTQMDILTKYNCDYYL